MISWRSVMACGLATVLALAGTAQAQPARISGSLSNFDVRYPPSRPNDLDILLYGPGLTADDVISTFPNQDWGRGEVIEEGINQDPTSPAFGLECIRVRYSGTALPDRVGQMMHFGVRLRPGTEVAHQEVWWTLDGQPVVRPCDPQIRWICYRRWWIVCVVNPNPFPIYVYGCRWFPVPPGVPLPRLRDLQTRIPPAAFGQQWIPLPLPGGGRVFCIPPWCRIYLRIPVVRWRPIVFQIAARNTDEDLGHDLSAPNPNDFVLEGPDGQPAGTMAILTARPTEEMAEDLDGDSVVSFFDVFASLEAFGQQSEDDPTLPVPEPMVLTAATEPRERYCLYMVVRSDCQELTFGDLVCVNCPDNGRCPATLAFAIVDETGGVRCSGSWRRITDNCTTCPPEGKKGWRFVD